MTTSKSKAVGSAAEREVAELLGGYRVGMDGGPIDVIVTGYAAIQVKKVIALPSLAAMHGMIERMDSDLLRGVVVIQRAGRGVRGSRTITFDFDEYATWHGDAGIVPLVRGANATVTTGPLPRVHEDVRT